MDDMDKAVVDIESRQPLFTVGNPQDLADMIANANLEVMQCLADHVSESSEGRDQIIFEVRLHTIANSVTELMEMWLGRREIPTKGEFAEQTKTMEDY